MGTISGRAMAGWSAPEGEAGEQDAGDAEAEAEEDELAEQIAQTDPRNSARIGK